MLFSKLISMYDNASLIETLLPTDKNFTYLSNISGSLSKILFEILHAMAAPIEY